jgi:hypothetical protein
MSVVRIEIEHSDGRIEFALDEDANQIWNWFVSAETMNLVHGAKYSGPKFKVRQREEDPKS